ncbi:MAG: hypothetical protein BIFFINMI_02043 [Phycisphaerae bacterium]|nr:hypothetical protein [Phycisphaerae bacterium]
MARQARNHSRSLVRSVTWVLDLATAWACLTGLVSLSFEYGFHRPPLPMLFLRLCELAVAAVFTLDIVGQYLLAESRRRNLRQRWADAILLATMATVVLAVGAAGLFGGAELSRGAFGRVLVVRAVQLFIVANLLARTVRLYQRIARSGMHPARLLIVSFLIIILLGGGALMLPRSLALESPQLLWYDALFTSTSAVCVTGLVVRATGTDQDAGTPARLRAGDLDVSGFSMFGQAVILSLIQIGGLGIMIIGTIIAVLLGQRLTLRHSILMKDLTSSQAVGQVGRIVRFIFMTTFLIEAIGACLLYSMWSDFGWSVERRAFYALFHSVSAFCNAGFSLTPDSLVRYHRYWQVHAVIGPLIVLGGLGFPVLMALYEWVASRVRRLVRRGPARGFARPLPLHAKLVLATSAGLIGVGALGLMLLESPGIGRAADTERVGRMQLRPAEMELKREAATQADPHAMRYQSAGVSLANAVFMSVTSRTAGFNSVNMNHQNGDLSQGSYFLLTMLMIVGGSPASTAGGMKTVVFAVLLLTLVSVVRGRERVEGFRRTLGPEILKRAATLALLYLGLVCTVALVLSVTESANRFDFVQILFESASACGTVGLSTGITSALTVPGRLVIIVAMFIGRVGPLTLLVAMMHRAKPARYELPAEGVVLG